MTDWTFLTNHALVLNFLTKQPQITARELSLLVGITERAIRRIIADLDAAKYISKDKEGRRVRYHVNPDLALRHESQQEIAVGDFIEVLGWKRRRKRIKSKV
ncbi:winged helix-turn-helix domain-containing protein [Chloroflexota bacterium]